ncbi:MAG: dihydroneopterin aldolase [Bacteroidales bacterium]|nr:dihydroneopterin aldolase [Bacteroidales bacterium]
MTTKICLKNIRFHSYIGCFEEEKIIGQLFSININITHDLTTAMLTDDINDTINYQNIYLIIADVMKNKYNLIERAAYKIIDELWRAYPQIENIELEINKLNPPIKADIESAAFYIYISKNEWESMQTSLKK